ncbi:GyrI-like domain-containing protein [Maribacter polysaccharolyticus]|uniref:GyrI-like domain-containing protein n=1 Tax=Maribacter polysaccharolyticus TaxID=3020831 RepID=UPI00237FAF43|nr:GyrI-like domain-containing protein [Maribacter polysaccharolyticus]MDE3741717.1 GyrI-like domain-containing protein [Maribacter polysaccharolyticus]
MLEPRIIELKEKKLVGKHMKMSMAQNRTKELWHMFMTNVKDLGATLSNDKISLQVYPKNYFDGFDPTLDFEKWATVEVADFNKVPAGWDTFVLPGGVYAVFDHQGADTGIFEYIYATWLPNSKYRLDDRPHFELLGNEYKNDHPDSKEEIWIPVRFE